jgi:uncharacterized protein (UPF0218 family)
MKKNPKDTLTLRPDLRRELKNPLGLLIKGTPKQTMKQLNRLIQKTRSPYVISVGDVVSQNMLEAGIQPHILIVDGRVMRERTQAINAPGRRKISVENPAGAIVPQTWDIVDDALKQKTPTIITVEGEEDMLTLVAVLKAPLNSLVVYGQPNEGVVAVRVDDTAKHKVSLIIEAMESVPKS